MTEIDSNVSLKGVTRSARIAHHAANLGSFVRSGASTAPSARLKPSTNFGATIRVRPTANEHPPLCLDPLFRRFKGDSKAARIKDGAKRQGIRSKALGKPGSRRDRHAKMMAEQSKLRVNPIDRDRD